MIFVSVLCHENTIVGFTARGHAGFAPGGRDIVCAAASMIIINTINSIDRLTKDRAHCTVNRQGGLIRYRIIRGSRESQLLLKSMVIGLKGIRQDRRYRRHMRIAYKEV